MLESTQGERSGLERGLAELAALGLVRPANVLLSEYLSALTAEDLLDVATAERVSAAYNRARYSAAADDYPDLREAVTSLNRVAQRLAALSPHDRQQIAKRIQGRIQSQPAEQLAERETESLASGWKTAPPPQRSPQSARRRRATRSSVEPALCTLESSDENGPLASPATPATRKRSLSPRVSLASSAVAALVTFFGGYFFRDNGNKLPVVGTDGASYGSEEPGARDPWKDLELWLNGIRWRADEEARSRQDDRAKCTAPVGLVRRCSALDRLGYELEIAYEPNNARMLNDLASMYLNPDLEDRTNPKRAWELAKRALDLTRQAAFLDTAAEAQYQCGNVREAIRLEKESLTKTVASAGDDQKFRRYRENQLKKFQDADQIRTAAQAPLSPLPESGISAPSIDPSESEIRGPLASGPSRKPAGS
ncbi:MAG TPA: hypothetical protein VG055_18555 [Planctomycetaceae bacterium]|nr:hypothetical protein [Planctomycetaceae bacterium]